MKKIIGLALLAGGIVLLVFGFQSKDSLESKASELFKGSPSDKTTWYLVGGAVCSVAGVGLILFKGK
jgi:hypothetical protein